MKAVKVTDKIYWVGVQNPDLRVFDVIMKTNWGTSYNSYLIRGSSKTALIDAVKDSFGEEQLCRIQDVCDPASIDYIICNHTEPDHSVLLRGSWIQRHKRKWCVPDRQAYF